MGKVKIGDYFELQRGGAEANLASMEGIRGLAVFLVFIVHYSTLIEPWLLPGSGAQAAARHLHAMGNVGVDLFFVLSGYLIYGSLLVRTQPFLRFMRRRVQRLYPVFGVVFFIYIVLSYAMPARSKIPSGEWDALVYLVQNFLLLPGIFPIEPLIAVAWSLSYEMLYYLVIPFVVGASGMRSWPTTARVAFFVFVGVLMIAVPQVVAGHSRLALFIAGILLFEAMHRPGGTHVGSLAGLVCLLSGLGISMLPIEGAAYGSRFLIAGLCVTFLVFCLACFGAGGRRPGWLSQAFSWSPMRWLGNMSYSFYLIHGLTLQAAFLALSKVMAPNADWSIGFWMALPPMFFAACVVSALLFLLVERPYSLAPRSAKPGG